MHSWAAQEYWGDFLVIAKVAAVFFLILKYLLVDRLSVALSTEGTAAYYNRNLFTCSLLIQAGSFMCSTQVSDLSLFYVKTRKSNNNYCRDWYNIINFLCVTHTRLETMASWLVHA